MFRLTDYAEVLDNLTNKFPCLIEDIDGVNVWSNTDQSFSTKHPINVCGELVGHVWTDNEILANKVKLFITLLITYYMEEK